MVFAQAASRVLRRIDPETAHHLAIAAIRRGIGLRPPAPDDPMLAVEVLGMRFANPIGLAAGFDKDAVAVPGLLSLGFGFVETGTVTPRPQPGNPRPRLFRLTEDQAVINRMGFNNSGLAAYVAQLRRYRNRTGRLGANVGINKEGADPERDYPSLIAAVAPYCDYVVINVSSPNTPGLRDLQAEDRLRKILDVVTAKVPGRPPLFVKIAPDLSDAGLAAVVETCACAGVNGLIVTNTTIARPAGLRGAARAETGGLSGAPLYAISTQMLARTFLLAAGRLALIGVGGIRTGAEALEKIEAGASLVQLYTAFALQGPAVIPRLKQELIAAMRLAGYRNLADAAGVRAARLAGG
jgi:dihydroorotate dehydrogenase